MCQATLQFSDARFKLVNDVLETVDGLLRNGSHCIICVGDTDRGNVSGQAGWQGQGKEKRRMEEEVDLIKSSERETEGGKRHGKPEVGIGTAN